jgi:predicted acyltransferase
VSAGAESALAKSTRLMSVDAFRGFDMFWIAGADALVDALHKMSDNVVVQGVATQLGHVPWAGFHFEDLIFPDVRVYRGRLAGVFVDTRHRRKRPWRWWE